MPSARADRSERHTNHMSDCQRDCNLFTIAEDRRCQDNDGEEEKDEEDGDDRGDDDNGNHDQNDDDNNDNDDDDEFPFPPT